MSKFSPANQTVSVLIQSRYYLPAHIRDHVDYVSPGVKLSATLKKTEIKRSQTFGRKHYGKPPGPKKWPKPDHPWSMPAAAGRLPADLRYCGVNITPTCIKALYDIPAANLKDPANVMGLYESGDVYSQEDLNLFFASYAPNVPQGTHPKLDSIDGGQAPEPVTSEYVTGESDIDMDLAYSLIYVSCHVSLHLNDTDQYEAANYHTLSGG